MYVFYLAKLRLPIAPPKLTMKINGQNKTINLIDGTEVNVLKKAGLTEVTFEARFPPYEYHFASYVDGYQSISGSLEYLEHLKQLNRGFQFMVYRQVREKLVIADDKDFVTNLTVSLESYEIVEDASDGLDCLVSITLKQYVPYGTKKIVFKKTKKSQATNKKKVSVKKERPAKEKKKKTYKVKTGDNLWDLARKFYGDSSKGKKIYQANKKTIEEAARKNGRKSSSNGWWIYPGTTLTIPKD